ncbi:MAG: site-2 protease family protein [Chloroflexi bacterium]|nr:site-2 protease family protein [Chloroflexota bacterium]
MTTVIAFLVVFIPIVLLHELGHFITAKLSGVKVIEFGIGLPPRIWSFKRGETTYALNAIPLGGYNKMLGEEDPSDPRSLAAKPAWKRAIVLSAGAGMNAVLALVLFASFFMIPQTQVVGNVVVDQVAADSPAARAGIQPGDIVRKVNGATIENSGDLRYQYQLRLGANASTVVERNGQPVKVSVTPRWKPPAGQGFTGIRVRLDAPSVVPPNAKAIPGVPDGPVEVRRHASFFPAIKRGGVNMYESLVLMKNGIQSWFIGSSSPSSDALGPIGIARVTGDAASRSVADVVFLAALISLNLAIFNILPFPALDGGRLFFLAIEVARRGKRIPPQKEALVHLAGFAILLVLIVAISFNDIGRLLQGKSPYG